MPAKSASHSVRSPDSKLSGLMIPPWAAWWAAPPPPCQACAWGAWLAISLLGGDRPLEWTQLGCSCACFCGSHSWRQDNTVARGLHLDRLESRMDCTTSESGIGWLVSMIPAFRFPDRLMWSRQPWWVRFWFLHYWPGHRPQSMNRL